MCGIQAIKLNNIIRASASGSITVGRFLREVARLYDVTTFEYSQILVIVSNVFYTAAYAAPQILLIKPKELECGKKQFYDVVNQYPELWDLSETYEYLPYFEAVNPVQRLQVKVMPNVLKLKAKEMGIELKKSLKCMYRRSVPASSNLFRAIDTFVTTLVHRLDVTDKVLRLAVKYHDDSLLTGITKRPLTYYVP